MRRALLALVACLATPVAAPNLHANEALLQASVTWPRPAPRPDLSARSPVAVSNLGFQRWIQEFWPRAQTQGIRAQTFNAAFAGVQYNADVISRDRNQSEFSKQIWEYLDGAVSRNRIETGRAMLRKYPTLLGRIEQRYGVEKEVIVAIWGLESSYGGYRGNTPLISALATLAYDGRRGAFFEAELINALKILQAGDVSTRGLRGSWAGAMGHTQFMPSSFLQYAVDVSGDGRRDIWSDDPSDALASTANYLARHGWKTGQPWAVEVRLPQGFDYALSGPDTQKGANAWNRMGVRQISGQPLPRAGRGSILLPAGARGPAFLIFSNFEAIKAYNSSTAYVLAVGHLSDRLAGRPAIQASWPRGDRALRSSEKRELQERLTAAGFSTNGIDGKVGPDTIRAIKRWQSARGLVPDGYANTALLQRLRGG